MLCNPKYSTASDAGGSEGEQDGLFLFLPTLNIVIIVWPFQSFVYCATLDTNNVLQRFFGHICSLEALFPTSGTVIVTCAVKPFA